MTLRVEREGWLSVGLKAGRQERRFVRVCAV